MGAYGLDAEEYDGEMISYVVDGEALQTYLGWIPFESPAEEIIIGKDDNQADISFTERIDKHMIESVIEALEKEMNK